MKLLKLEIENLASLDKEGGEVIDFTTGALGETNIFSIVGPTGSGKSTILDAICLALYNLAPRYPRKKNTKDKIKIYGAGDSHEANRLSPNDNRNILTRGKKQGYSKLTFLANNGTVYRAEWHVSFKQKKYDDIVTKLIKLVQKGEQLIEEEANWEELPQIIGLDYEQFLRTVLIAQGSFANFLTAKEDERYELLEKIVGGGDTYQRVAALVKQRSDEAVEAFTQINATVDAVKDSILDDEKLAALKDLIEQLDKAEKALDEEQKRLEVALKWYDDEVGLQHAEADAKRAADNARAALESIRVAMERLDLHVAISPAVDLLREVNRLTSVTEALEKDIKKKSDSLTEQETSIKNEEEKLETLNAAVKKAKQEQNEQMPHIKVARELKTKIGAEQVNLKEKEGIVNQAEKEKKDAGKALTQNAKDIDKAKQAEETAKAKLTKAEEQITQKRKTLADALTLAQQELNAESQKIEGQKPDVLLKNQQSATQTLNDVKKAIEVTKTIETLTQERQAKASRYQKLSAENSKLAAKLETLTIEKLTQELETLRSALTLMTCENWEQHRAALKPGEACPLCGSTEHPYVADGELYNKTTNGLQSMIDEKRALLDGQQTKEKSWSKTKSQNEGEMKQIEERQLKIEQDLSVQESAWEPLHLLHTDWPKNSEQLKTLLPTYQQQSDEATAAQQYYNNVSQRVSSLNKAKENAQKVKEDYEQEASELQTKKQDAVAKATYQVTGFEAVTSTLEAQVANKELALAQALTNCQQAKERIAVLQQQFANELGDKDPDQEEQRLQDACKASETLVEKQKEAIGKLNNKYSGTKGELQTLTTRLQQEKTALTQKNAELADWIAAYNAQENRLKEIALTDVELMRAATDNWEQISKQKERRMNEQTSAQTLLKQASENHEKHGALRPEQSREELLAAKQSLEGKSQQQELIAAKARLKNHEDAKLSLGGKDAELQKATLLKENWGSISKAMGSADGKLVRRIAQCYTLGFLIEHANDEIRKFNKRYELMQVKNSLGIRVIDHDRADDVRETTSLSGGETFIVSLGLALGLSALSSRNISFENLFIDEGFGTLDPDMLALVIDSLAMLQNSQGKKVGVISHTDTMSERITTQIRVIKHGTAGSSHIEIYP